MKNNDTTRSDLIKQLYNSYHEGEAALPDSDAARNYVFDEGTGTLYCKETDKQYNKSAIDEAMEYFVDIAKNIEGTISTSADPYKQLKKAEYCKIAAEAIEYFKNHLV